MAQPYSVVLVPGILGSRLTTTLFGGVKRIVWFDPGLVSALSPLTLALASDGISPFPGVGYQLTADAPVNLGVYEPLMQALNSVGYNVYFWPYDWRLKPDLMGLSLATALQQLPLTNPFNVVCHSMGGLVAQFAYPAYLAAGNNPKWATTSYIATPHGGSHWAPMCLNGLLGVGGFWALLGQLWNLSTWTSPALLFAFNAYAALVGTMVGSWPSTYALLPSNQGPWNSLDPLAGLALALGTYNGGPGGVQQQWLTYAAGFMSSIVAMLKQPRPFEMSFIGNATPTPRQFLPGGNYQTLAGYGNTNAGDGTVAVERAFGLQTYFEEFDGSTHIGLVDSATVQGHLAAYLKNNPIGGGGADFNDEPPFKGPPLQNWPVQNSTIMHTWASEFANTYLDP